MTFDMPVGQPIFVKGNLTLSDDLFGFFYTEIISPQSLNIPILPYRTNDGGVYCPTGSWFGWYFTEELKQACKLYGYKVNLLYGYKFERESIFTKFVNNFYNIRLKTEKNSPENVIAKLILNSVFGRTGMSPIVDWTSILNEDEFTQLLSQHDITEFHEIGDSGKFIVRQSRVELTDSHNNSNVAIASAITAYSRMHINKYKFLPNNNVFYSDTDSVFLQHPLNENEVSNTLGAMKLENGNISRAVFLGPKCYALELQNGEHIIKIKGLTKSSLPSFNDMLS